MRLKRIPVRLAEETLVAVDALSRRYAEETQTPASRRGLLRLLVEHRLASIDPGRPLTEQLPVAERARERAPSPRQARGDGSLRRRVLAQISTHPDEVYSPARLMPLVGARNDSVRNALLVLAARAQIEKLGPGQYRACRGVLEPRAEEDHP